jgi:hypothetical protein
MIFFVFYEGQLFEALCLANVRFFDSSLEQPRRNHSFFELDIDKIRIFAALKPNLN